MNRLTSCFLSACFAVLLLASSPLAHAKDDWQPITPEDLKLKDNPAVPGSKAMILYRSIAVAP
jgi:hypothetical protein